MMNKLDTTVANQKTGNGTEETFSLIESSCLDISRLYRMRSSKLLDPEREDERKKKSLVKH